MKTDMVELMLMQNAQMHQIIMHNMMLKALPAGGGVTPSASHSGQVIIQGCCVCVMFTRCKLQCCPCCIATLFKFKRRRHSSPPSLRFSWTTSSSYWLLGLATLDARRTRRHLSSTIRAACDWSSHAASVKHVRVNKINKPA